MRAIPINIVQIGKQILAIATDDDKPRPEREIAINGLIAQFKATASRHHGKQRMLRLLDRELTFLAARPEVGQIARALLTVARDTLNDTEASPAHEESRTLL